MLASVSGTSLRVFNRFWFERARARARFLRTLVTTSFDERPTPRITLQRTSPSRLSGGSDDNAEITVREEVCSSRSPKRYAILCLPLVFATARTPDDDISNEGWLDDKTDVYSHSRFTDFYRVI